MLRIVVMTAAFAIVITGVANAQLSIVDSLPGVWIDISGSGTALNLSDDGEVDIHRALAGEIFLIGRMLRVQTLQKPCGF